MTQLASFHSAVLVLIFASTSAVWGQTLPVPPHSLVRIRPFDGGTLYGCASQASTDTITFRLRAGGMSHRFKTTDCAADSVRIPIRRLESIEVGQLERRYTRTVTQGALLGAATAGAAYWSLGKSARKCSHCYINTAADWMVSGAIGGGLLGAARRRASPRLWWVTLKGAEPDTGEVAWWRWVLDRAKLGATAGAGYSGIRVAEVLRTDSTAEGYVPVANYRYDWRPALSTGIVSYIFSSAGSNLGAGLGVQIVALPSADGKTFPFPAATLHMGTPETEFFVGLVLSPTDGVNITRATPRQAHSVDPNRFLAPSTRTSRHLYMGIQVKGTRKGASDIGIPEGAEIVLGMDTVAYVGDTVRLAAHLEDSARNILAGPPAQFTAPFGYGRMVDSRKLVADSSGIVVVRVRIGAREKEVGIEFKKKPDTKSDTTGTPRDTVPAGARTGASSVRFYFGSSPAGRIGSRNKRISQTREEPAWRTKHTAAHSP